MSLLGPKLLINFRDYFVGDFVENVDVEVEWRTQGWKENT